MADSMTGWKIRDTKEQIGSGSILMDDWELKKLIGRGGFGDVWLAEKSSVGILEQAAVKIIRIPRDPGEIQAMRAEGMSDQSIQAELRRSVESAVREIRVMIDLQSHPAVVQHKGFDVIQYEEDGTWEIDIRMQLLKPLADWINASGGKSEDAVRLGIALSDLLTVCERKHILHRDIKPANIFVDELGNFRLGDFGLARVISEAGSAHSKGVGTETFMAPEVFIGGVYDHRADLYTLGLVIYWMLNGMNLPFMHEGVSRSEATARRLAGETLPPLAGVDPELEQIIRKACEADPDQRWKTAKEFHDALVRLQYKRDAMIDVAVTDLVAAREAKYASYRKTGKTVAAVEEAVDTARKAEAGRTEETRSYTITWKDDAGNIISTDNVEYGALPVCQDPTKASDQQFFYIFSGWSPAIKTVTGDKTYTATFAKIAFVTSTLRVVGGLDDEAILDHLYCFNDATISYIILRNGFLDKYSQYASVTRFRANIYHSGGESVTYFNFSDTYSDQIIPLGETFRGVSEIRLFLVVLNVDKFCQGNIPDPFDYNENDIRFGN